jgi:biopolymer transport protein ExbD
MKLKKKNQNPEIPTASMADIAFLLIVFFMVTSVFSVTRGLEFQLPQQENEPPTDENQEEAIHIRILPAGSGCIFEVDQQDRSLADIQIYIEPILARNPNKYVIIDPANDAPYRCMVDVFDELKQAQVRNISIPTSAEKAAWGNIF